MIGNRMNRLGAVPFSSPFTLAALSGYSDLGMRVTCRRLGASLTRHEVILDQFVLDEGTGARSGRHMSPEDHPVVCQLMGSDATQMAEAAVRMEAFGYDVIDINFGCPVRKVLGRCRGGYLLGDPPTAIEILRAVRRAVRVPVTVKMRRGRDDTPISEECFWTILSAAVGLGYAGVVVHGRTVQQKYEGQAQWDIIRRAKERFGDLVVFGSGDLFTADDCVRMLNETGCDGVTIARGAINNPWIFRECLALWSGAPLPPAPTVQEQGELYDQQYRLSIQQYGADRAGRQMRKFGIKRAHLHPDADRVREAFVNLESTDQWEALLEEFYGVRSNALTPT